MVTSLICSGTESRVSSVLNRDTKQFGKKFLFDNNEETCWSSDQGSTQWVLLEFPQTVNVSELLIQFQGGFAGRLCRLEGDLKGEFFRITEFYPEDSNTLQRFCLKEPVNVNKLKIIFENSADFFGRIILYHLDVRGEKF